MTNLEDAGLTKDMEKGAEEKAQDHGPFSGSPGKNPYLCGTEFWQDLSDSLGREENELSDVQGDPQRLQPVFHRGDFKKIL